MNAKPLLSDLPSSKLKPNPGDRIIAKVSFDLSVDQLKKIERSIKGHFSGVDIRLLIVNCMKTRVVWWQKKQNAFVTLSDPKEIRSEIPLGVVNLDCVIVDLKEGDALTVTDDRIDSKAAWFTMHDYVKRWAGNDVNLIVHKKGF